MRRTKSFTGLSPLFMPRCTVFGGRYSAPPAFNLLRRPVCALEGEIALDHIGEFLGIGMNMPGQHGAGREDVGLGDHLFAVVAGQRLDEKLLRGDGAWALGLAREHEAGTGDANDKHAGNDPVPQSHGFTPSRPIPLARLGL